MENVCDLSLIKRNTTPILPIKINMQFEGIKQIEFIFKRRGNERNFVLLSILLNQQDLENYVKVFDGYFIVYYPISQEQTKMLPEGYVYMDTRILLYNSLIPTTTIVKLKVGPTLFEEVIVDGAE